MEDPNSIAWLSPAMSKDKDKNGRSWEAIRMNISQDIQPQGETKSNLRSRESTVSLEDEEDQTASYPRCRLAFNSEIKSSHGLVFGTDPNSCNIVLPKLKYISNRHCYLTFDEERRLILRDCSTHGTMVKYDDKGGELRRHFTWILGGHRVPKGTKRIVIEIQGVSFQIEVSRHNANPNQYSANVNRFLNKVDEPHLNGLGIYSPTAPSSQSHTPNQSAIRLKQETLGKGAFAVVRRYWDVSTGIEYAYKEPLDKRRFDRKLWEKEADIMGQISHGHVVNLIESTLTPSPRLVLEYVPFGSLEGLELSLDESMIVLRQGLSALADLHGREAPIVHRDIKPANILLKSLNPLHIKLTDFGLSRASNDLTTFCGTRLYLAPEVYQRKTYSPAVDIWSLGLVAFECACGLPDNCGYEGRDWCELLVDQVNDWEDGDLVNLLSSTMIIMDPRLRQSAQDCYKQAYRLSSASQERCRTPTPASYAQEYKPAEGQEVGIRDIQTLSNVHNSFHPSNVRYIRSDAPPPSSGAPTIIANFNSGLQRVESVPGINLFGEGWLQDPNCVGSSVAAMGQESSDLSSWDNWATEPSMKNGPRNILEPVSERDRYNNPPLGPGGNTFKQSTYHTNAGAQGAGGYGQAVEGGQINSEDYMAAHLLYAIHQGEIP